MMIYNTLPLIRARVLEKGVEPLVRGYQKSKIKLIGFDTETINNWNWDIENKTVLVQIKDNPHTTKLSYHLDPSINNLNLFLGTEKTTFCTAHNLPFDLVSLIGFENTQTLEKGEVVGGWKGKVYLSGKKSNATISNGKHKIVFVDSRAILGGSLAYVASDKLRYMNKGLKPKILGVRVPKTPLELLRFEEYSQQDAEIQYEVTCKINEFFKENDITLSSTLPTIASKIFRRSYLKKPLKFNMTVNDAGFIYNCYHGARWEAYGRGHFTDIKQYDINSNFPFVATQIPFNFSDKKYQEIKDVDDFLNKSAYGFMKVKFKYPESVKYPNLPVKQAVGELHKQTYPSEGVSFCTSPELIEANRLGCELDVTMNRGWYPTESDYDNPIKQFMLDGYDKRFEDNLIDYKGVMNMLVGKFAQKQEENGVFIAGGLFRPDFAGLILGGSRALASELINDTDALYVGCDGVFTGKRLPTSDKLGGLKQVNGEKITDVVIIRSRLYFVKCGDKISGSQHGCYIEPEKFWEAMHKTDESIVRVPQDRMVTYNQGISWGVAPHKFRSGINKVNVSEDGKRKYLEDLPTAMRLTEECTLSNPLRK